MKKIFICTYCLIENLNDYIYVLKKSSFSNPVMMVLHVPKILH